MDRSGPEQQRRGGAAALAGHEGRKGPAGVSLARPARGITDRLGFEGAVGRQLDAMASKRIIAVL